MHAQTVSSRVQVAFVSNNIIRVPKDFTLQRLYDMKIGTRIRNESRITSLRSLTFIGLYISIKGGGLGPLMSKPQAYSVRDLQVGVGLLVVT